MRLRGHGREPRPSASAYQKKRVFERTESGRSGVSIGAKKRGIEEYPLIGMDKRENYLTASLRALPAVNFGVFAAGMVITAPVLGLRPFLDFLFTTPKVPNPTRVTF